MKKEDNAFDKFEKNTLKKASLYSTLGGTVIDTGTLNCTVNTSNKGGSHDWDSSGDTGSDTDRYVVS